MSRYAVKTRADSPELRKAAAAIEQVAWASLGFVNYTRAHFAHYEQLLEEHADCQLVLVDEDIGYPVAVGNCVPLACDFDALPDEGWDWIVETSATGKKPHNAIGALAISVPGVHRGKGLARIMIQAFHDLARRRGLEGVIAPVRPSDKWRHPFTPIEEYISWTDDRGRAYDPWLRSHLACGGRIIGPARRSMVVEEPIGFWEAWTGKQFEQSGEYALDGALVPLKVDRERAWGSYVEPNVWFAYAA